MSPSNEPTSSHPPETFFLKLIFFVVDSTIIGAGIYYGFFLAFLLVTAEGYIRVTAIFILFLFIIIILFIGKYTQRFQTQSPNIRQWKEFRSWPWLGVSSFLVTGVLLGLTELFWMWNLSKVHLLMVGVVFPGFVLRAYVRYFHPVPEQF